MHMNKYAVFGHTIAMASPILSWMLMKPTSELLWYFEGSIQDLSDVADAIRTTAYIHVPAVPAEVIYSADSNYENDMLCYLTLKTAFHDYKKNSIEDDLKAMLTKVFDTSYADKNNFLRSIDMALLGSFVNDVTRVDYVSK